MFQALTIIVTITGLFRFLDLFAEKNAKAKVAEYVFGFGNVDLAGFENNVITALLSPFKKEGRISLKRVFLYYSLIVAILINLVATIAVYFYGIVDISESEILNEIIQSILLTPFMALAFVPFDYWSLWVTNKIFSGEKSSSLIHFLGRVVVDVVITLLPVIILLILVLSSIVMLSLPAPETDDLFWYEWIIAFTAMVFIGNIIGSLLITIIQLLTLTLGIVFRTVLRLTKFNQHIAMVSRANEFPFTFIGLFVGLTGALVSAFTL